MPETSETTETINPKAKRKYGHIDTGKAFTMRMQGMTMPDIAKVMGVSKVAVFYSLKKFQAVLDNPQAVQVYDKNIDKLLSASQLTLLSDALSPEKLKKSGTYQNIASYGILYDKQRLVRSQPTQIVATLDLDPAILGRIQELESMLIEGETVPELDTLGLETPNPVTLGGTLSGETGVSD